MGTVAQAAQSKVSWDDNSVDEKGFIIERAEDGKEFAQIGTVPANVTTFIDSAVSAGSLYWYRIRAFSDYSDSDYSNVAGADPTSSSFALPQNGEVASKLANLSARAIAGTGDRSLIVGFVVQGGSRPVLVRAVGPSLAAFGVSNALPDPRLTILDGAAVVSQNDNWGGVDRLSSVFAQLGASSLPSESRDAAILSDFASRGYTVLINGTTNSGVAMAEVYDAVPSSRSSARLMNLSARAHSGSGDAVLIVGFVITGSTSMRVLVRAVGPTLATYGVSDALADPQLELFHGSMLIARNDDWLGRKDLRTAFADAGAFALPDSTTRDAALTAFLPPGAYTAIVSGVAGQTGVALAEVYELP